MNDSNSETVDSSNDTSANNDTVIYYFGNFTDNYPNDVCNISSNTSDLGVKFSEDSY